LAKQLVPKITQFFSAVSVTVSNHQADLELFIKKKVLPAMTKTNSWTCNPVCDAKL